MKVASCIIVLAVAVAFRMVGLGWGLPRTGRNYPYHPDEPVVALAALQVDFAHLQLSPRMFNYGSLSPYLDRLAVDATAATGWMDLKIGRASCRERV